MFDTSINTHRIAGWLLSKRIKIQIFLWCVGLDNVKTFPKNPQSLTNLKLLDDNSIDGGNKFLLQGNYAFIIVTLIISVLGKLVKDCGFVWKVFT